MKKRNASFRSRLAINITLTIFGVIAFLSATAAWLDVVHYREHKRDYFSALTAAYSVIVGDSLQQQSIEDANQALAEMGLPPTAAYVCIETSLGGTFAAIGVPTPPQKPPENPLDLIDTLTHAVLEKIGLTEAVYSNIVRNGETIGIVHIEPDLTELKTRLQRLVSTWLIASTLTAFISFLTIMPMIKSIAYPIQSLNKAMQTVRKTGDFRRRVKRISQDETGELADSFNAMLNYIQERDQQLRTNRQNLREMVRKRTEQLNNAKEAAEEASRAKSEFLATMSHEIRTPMNGMMVLAQLLSSSSLGKRQQRYADLIVKSGDSLLAIINDILDLSKIEAGQMALEAIPVKPAEIIDDVIGLFHERAREEGLDLAAHISADTPEEIKGDPTRLNQVLSNLVNNAIKFTNTGSILVAAQLLKRPDGVTIIEFSVTDTGVGIAPDKQRQIFDAFTQEDQSTTRKFGGSGLGLAICSKIVRDMNGDISVKSKINEGSRFSFTLPAEIITPPLAPPACDRAMHAMIAIDGAAAQQSLARYLHESGVTSRIEGSAKLTATHMNYADVIFGSPSILQQYAKALEKTPHAALPARICVTPLDNKDGDPLLAQGEANDLLTSPFSRQEVMAQLERLFTDNLRGESALDTQQPSILKLPSFEGAKILAADDSAVNRAVVRAALGRFDANPDIVADGRAALKAAQTIAYDLILMDCSMPEMDGFEATRAIRAFEEKTGRARTPIIALTAHVANVKQEWRSAGMDAYVLKPFTINSLGQEIARHITPAGFKDVSVEPDDTDPAPTEDSAPRAQKTSNTSMFDMATLTSLANIQENGGEALVARALALFADHSKEAFSTLCTTLESGPNPDIARAAHALKSMSVNVGASALAQTCADIELKASEGEETSQMTKQLQATFRKTHKELPNLQAHYESRAA